MNEFDRTAEELSFSRRIAKFVAALVLIATFAAFMTVLTKFLEAKLGGHGFMLITAPILVLVAWKISK